MAKIFGLDFGETNAASRIVYGLVGLAAVYESVVLIIRGRAIGRTHGSHVPAAH